MPENDSQHPAPDQSVTSIVGQPTAVVGSAEANVGIPKLSDAEFADVMEDYTRIAQSAEERLRRSSSR